MKSINKVIKTTILTLFILPLLLSSASAQQKPDKVIHMKGTDNLKFSKENIKARAGQVIKVELEVISDFSKAAMAHNFALLNLKADPSKVAAASAQYSKNEYIAPEMENVIIAHTAMGGDGETVSVTFQVPQKPAEYPYICTFPGHFSGGMKGTLKVVSGKASAGR